MARGRHSRRSGGDRVGCTRGRQPTCEVARILVRTADVWRRPDRRVIGNRSPEYRRVVMPRRSPRFLMTCIVGQHERRTALSDESARGVVGSVDARRDTLRWSQHAMARAAQGPTTLTPSASAPVRICLGLVFGGWSPVDPRPTNEPGARAHVPWTRSARCRAGPLATDVRSRAHPCEKYDPVMTPPTAGHQQSLRRGRRLVISNRSGKYRRLLIDKCASRGK
jgi:hypothetical protein